jgi:phosphoenolpyruvate carboxykinase (ATP)
VLPPVSKLTPEQASYHFISGYTAKVAGTEMGVKEPSATFSACFGAAFMMWHPNKYATLLTEKMKTHKTTAWLVNTGWTGGDYGVGSRIKLKYTRAIIDAIHDGSLENAEFHHEEDFGLALPTRCNNVPSEILIPESTWADKERFRSVKSKLVQLFIDNFNHFEGKVSPEIAEAGPKVH